MKKSLKTIISFLICLAMILCCCGGAVPVAAKDSVSSVTVATNKGKIRGYTKNGINVFKGIPYAKPPVGNLRWKEPVAMDKWSGVKDCSKFGANAWQMDQKTDETYSTEFIVDTSLGYSEDCLYLNVWSKNDQKKKKPVIVYVHGGAFVAGGSSCEVYDGTGMANKDAVFVSLNYRLGAMGFYSNPELSEESADGTSGNYALKDILMALEWVRNNAAEFGGDPNNITLMGQSAGACLTEILAASPATKGLIQKAVVLSYPIQQMGGSLELNQAQDVGRQRARGKSVKELRALSAADVVQQIGNLYTPVIDGKIVTDTMMRNYLDGTAPDIPIMYGSVEGDLIFEAAGLLTGNVDEMAAALTTVGSVVLHPGNSTLDDRETLMANYAATATARDRSMSSPSYLVFYSYAMPGENSQKAGAFHTSDVPYWLDNLSPRRNQYWTETDYKLAKQMSAYLMNFARSGNPNGKGIPFWSSFEKQHSYLVINDNAAMNMEQIDGNWSSKINKIMSKF